MRILLLLLLLSACSTQEIVEDTTENAERTIDNSIQHAIDSHLYHVGKELRKAIEK